MLKEHWGKIALAAYLAGAVVAYGHYVTRSDACGASGGGCEGFRTFAGLYVAATWPLYLSIKAWER